MDITNVRIECTSLDMQVLDLGNRIGLLDRMPCDLNWGIIMVRRHFVYVTLLHDEKPYSQTCSEFDVDEQSTNCCLITPIHF
jgi:hypothetical protein